MSNVYHQRRARRELGGSILTRLALTAMTFTSVVSYWQISSFRQVMEGRWHSSFSHHNFLHARAAILLPVNPYYKAE